MVVDVIVLVAVVVVVVVVVAAGPCNSLETEPSISVVFASFWKWSLSPVRFLQDIGPRNRAFAGLDAAVSTAPATLWSSNF